MRVLPITCVLLIVGLHYSTCGESSVSTDKLRLGEALIRRARALAELQNKKDSAKTEENKIKDMDMLEDIFVGSGSQNADKLEASGSRREDVDNKDTTAVNGNENGENFKGDVGGMDSNASGEVSSTSEAEMGNGQHDTTSGSELLAEDQTATESVTKSTVSDASESEQHIEISSGSGLVSLESDQAVPASKQEASRSNPAQTAVGEQTGNGASTQTVASGEDSSGPSKSKQESFEDASKKSDIQSSGNSEEDDSGSAEVIRKGMESLSRLLTPVASGYHFELYSGNVPQTKTVEINPGETVGESDDEQVSSKTKSNSQTENDSHEKSESKEKNDSKEKIDSKEESDAKEENEQADVEVEPVKEKVCRKECRLPMTYETCAVPRCEKKMGSIKDLCYWLCKHQKEVCEQKCEYIERN